MCGVVQDFSGKARVVGESFGGQSNRVRPIGPGEAFAGQRMPDYLVEQAGRVMPAHHRIAEMKVIRMGTRKLADGELARPRPFFAGFGQARERLKNRERSQLQRIEFESVFLWRHGGAL